jgi:hypothetical protein
MDITLNKKVFAKGFQLEKDSRQKWIERRTDLRNPYAGHIFFATQKQLFEGELKNFCKHGLFIKTLESLYLGEFITVALPYMDVEQGKVQGQILWSNDEGYGVELVRNRDDSFYKVLKLEARSG